jgi:3'-phosphoadenosine 5'-phosphosulfate sulfotransferase (PAPS reductase)/FAD synthetase
MNTMIYSSLTNIELVEEAHEIIAKAKERCKPTLTLAMFSGGNDSTTMLRLVKDQIDAAVHIRTGIGIESTFDHVRRVCQAWKIKLIVLETDPKVFRSIVLDLPGKSPCRGFPGPGMHFVPYNRLKQHRIGNLQRDYSKRGEQLLLVSGVRYHESKRRKMNVASVDYQKDQSLNRIKWCNPIRKFDSRDMANLRQELETPQCEAAGLIHKSGECLCGAFAKPGELEELEYWFPDVGKYIRDLEREAVAAGKHYCKWGHGMNDRKKAKPVGPLCQGCELFDKMENNK